MSMPAAESTPAAAVRSIRDLPGPRGWPVLGNAPQIDSERFHQQIEAWAKAYGPQFRFRIASRQFVAFSEPEHIAHVLRQRPHAFQRGPRLEMAARDMGFPGLFSSNGETWKRQRPLVLAGLDPAHIRTFLPAMLAVLDKLRARWEAAARAGREIDLLADLMRFTVDVTTSLAFGQNLDTLEKGDEDAIQQHLNVILPALFKRILAPFNLPRPGDLKLRAHVQALGRAVAEFIARAHAQLDADPALREKPENLIQALIAARDRAENPLTDSELSGNVLTMLLAGEDTTANTLAWMIWLLARNPEAQAGARAEVDRVVGRGAIVQSIEHIAALDEVEACANEAMRLKPVAPLIINHCIEDTVVGDVLVPRGAFVVCAMRAPAMDAGHFPEPQRFDPGRWLAKEGGGASLVGSAKRVVMPFGAGARICPGRYLALAEIKMVAAMLLSHFDIVEVAPRDGGAEPVERLTLTMAPVGLRMRLAPRR